MNDKNLSMLALDDIEAPMVAIAVVVVVFVCWYFLY